MGGRKRVSGGAAGKRTVVTGWTCVLAGMPLGASRLTASETEPHWHWQPDDLQQSCVSSGVGVCKEQAPSSEALMLIERWVLSARSVAAAW